MLRLFSLFFRYPQEVQAAQRASTGRPGGEGNAGPAGGARLLDPGLPCEGRWWGDKRAARRTAFISPSAGQGLGEGRASEAPAAGSLHGLRSSSEVLPRTVRTVRTSDAQILM